MEPGVDRTGPVPRIMLLGMMGSGKSSVGSALGDATGWPFVDNDALVERATGRTARELLAVGGVDAMREAESAALRAGLAIRPPAIVATAAGTVLRADDRELIAGGGLVAWLRATAAVLAARATGADHRPWLEDDPLGWFERALAERDPLYASIADIAIDTGTSSPAQAAEAILARCSAGG
jgi:shikimate kinase